MNAASTPPTLAVNSLRSRLIRRLGLRYADLRRRFRSPRRRDDVVVDARGPAWLRSLVTPTASVGDQRDADRTGATLIVVDADRVEPFVQPALSNPVRRTWPSELPEPYERLARAASYLPADAGSGPPLGPIHRSYRAAHRHALDRTLDDLLTARGGRVGSRSRSVTVVCVTNRPPMLDAVVGNFRRQTWEHKRLIVVTNAHGFDPSRVGRLVDQVDGEVIRTDPQISLGACLNLALERSDTRYVAKVDDDDIYGEHYLEDLMLAHGYAGAGVVGKHCYFAHLADTDETILRFPGGDFRYTPYLAGGTLVIDRERTGSVRFPDVSVGEDQGFVVACLRRGVSTFSADRFNYVQVRAADNTWRADDASYLTSYEPVGPGLATDVALI